ncbi:hypothetical protein ASF45_26485 [Pseudorhodoferax sp. Leaf265]|nr:hypothetical protein ASF45_26485 [Pseudorhodoferax sp. Leaf265]
MGAVGLALSVLAFSAPLTTVAGYIPVALMFGGTISPLIFIGVMVLMMLFSLGYLTLNNEVKRPGDFYSFISYGLGKKFGLGSGLLAIVTYFVILTGVPSYFGVASAELLAATTGIAVPWYCFTFACLAAIAVLGYLHVELSAKVLTIVMVAEVVICLAFGITVLQGEAAPTYSTASMVDLGRLFTKDAPFAMLFAVSFFMGFEATALFRNEVRDPARTIPRATIGAVLSIGALYTFAAVSLVWAYGGNVQSVATNAPASMFMDAFEKHTGPGFRTAIGLLVLTSAFASSLAIHNVLSRYLFNLGGDGALPRFLNRVHVRHASPAAASVTVSVAVVAVLSVVLLFGAKPEILYGQFSGVGTAGGVMLMLVVNISCLVWYVREGRHRGVSFWKACAAPVVSSIGFFGLITLIATNFHLLVGGEPGERTWMIYIIVGVLAAGVLLASFYEREKPEVYGRLGSWLPADT